MIASVLLILSAISVAVIVANFSFRTEERVGERVISMGESIDCADVRVSVESFTEGNVVLKNRGTLGLIQVRVREYSVKGVDVYSDNFNGNVLMPGGESSYRVKDGVTKLEIIPVFESDRGELIGCEDKTVVWEAST